MRTLIAAACFLCLYTGVRAAEPAPAPAPAAAGAPASDEQKTTYTMGYLSGMNLLRYRLRPDEFAAFQAGLEAAYKKQAPAADPDAWRAKIQAFAAARDAEAAIENKRAGAQALAAAAAQPDARTTASGLVIKTVKAGSGPSPADSDSVKVKYAGRLTDGSEFDTSEKRGGTVTFGVGGVIACWAEALKLMKVGEIAELYCPPEIAYGDRGFAPAIPGGSTLHFTIELVGIEPPRVEVPPAAAPPPKQTP